MNRVYLIVPIVLAVLAAAVIACGGGDSKQVKLGDQTFTDKGTKDATGAPAISIKAGDFYFEPTFVRGAPGQKIKLELVNDTSTLHNASVPALLLDEDISAKSKTELDVT